MLRMLARTENTQSSAPYETLKVTQPFPYVSKVQLNRPEKSNAMNSAFWRYSIELLMLIRQLILKDSVDLSHLY